MDKVSPLFKDLRKNKTKLQQFLDACQEQHQKADANFDHFREGYYAQVTEADRFFRSFRTSIEEVPFEVAIEQWLDVYAASAGLEDAFPIFETLIRENVIQLEDTSGEVLTLGNQALMGHTGYIEEIRCLPMVSLGQRERMVDLYLQFSRYLSQATLGFVPAGADPDRLKAEKKMISYDAFLDFVQNLSERDGLMAYLMYLDEPNMIEVIDLKVSQVNIKECRISFDKFQASYPKHIIQRLKAHTRGKKSEELVFQNRTKGAVNRGRLYRAFKTASSKMTPPQEIIPTKLLERRP